MVLISSLLLFSAVAVAVPAPTPTPTPVKSHDHGNHSTTAEKNKPWNAGAVPQYPIHESCNATQRRQIEAGLNETILLANHAKDHILRWGNDSSIYRKYFGDRPSIEAIGAYDIVVNGNKDGVLFRCDNPDNNCELEGWAGHWRGENATSETVICEMSYHTRRYLTTMCAMGYTVAGSDIATFWAADLLHRLYHVPAIGQLHVDHFADSFEEVIDLAKSNKTESTRDSETLQLFALEAYAYDISVPGVGCAGESHVDEEEEDVPENCHTHDGGVLHCT
ncbi:hypothetical protein FE257_005409 [Aspergillus nanangensis]|uniref:Putative peptidase domain-containing protein n=1 Tax=Aspergillus nanangensis TaxID=2582783 RepID=A0AAD4CS84_ASPNN|nr:hypothetical protein FE257_005409 [Aspergillus nanangensis]